MQKRETNALPEDMVKLTQALVTFVGRLDKRKKETQANQLRTEAKRVESDKEVE